MPERATTQLSTGEFDYGYDSNRYMYTSGGSHVSIDGGRGNDLIRNLDDYVLIDGGAGNDSIYNEGAKVSINGGAGNDFIYNGGRYGRYGTVGDSVTINAGAGNDLISLKSEYPYSENALIKYNAGDGTGSYSTTKSGSDVIVTVGDGNFVDRQH